MGMDGQEKRRHARMRLPYTMQFRRAEPGARKTWDAVTPINMSESGICFFTMEELPEKTSIQFHISNPLGDEELLYQCRVLRCSKSASRSVFYETVVTIEEASDQAMEVYKKLLLAFSNPIARKQLGL